MQRAVSDIAKGRLLVRGCKGKVGKKFLIVCNVLSVSPFLIFFLN